MNGPCLCGDPGCRRCFPGHRGQFNPGDLADVLAAYSLALARNFPSPDLSALAAVDVASLIELTIQAVQSQRLQYAKRELDAALDSRLAGVIVDLIYQVDLDAETARAEK